MQFTHLFGEAQLWTAVLALPIIAAMVYFGNRHPRRVFLFAVLPAFLLTFLVVFAYLFLLSPVFTGAWLDHFLLLALAGSATAVVVGLLVGLATDQDYEDMWSGRGVFAAWLGSGITIGSLVLVLLLVGNTLAYTTHRWFDGNLHDLARLGHIVAAPKTATLPPTDIHHILLVTQDVAAYKGQQVIASGGNNLGSRFEVDHDDYTIQAIAGHLYWVAPLVPRNIWFESDKCAPGYAVVDAENPNVPAALHLDHTLCYFTHNGYPQTNVLRAAWLDGYQSGMLTDPTLEVDDTWHPWYTITVTQPTKTFGGDTPTQVLVMNPVSGAIHAYPLDAVPAWVDRVMPAGLVKQYAAWWGSFATEGWTDFSGQNQMQPADDPMLLYNTADHPVWVIPMTSTNGSDSSSTGILVASSQSNHATFYPIAGVGVGGNVANTLSTNPQNLRHYDVSTPQLYQLYGRLTWVGIFTQRQGDGQASFQGVGLVDANNLNGSAVVMAPSLDLALGQYQQYLATAGTKGPGAVASITPTTITGKVLRINAQTLSGTTIYSVLLSGNPHLFTASATLSPQLVLAAPGDTVRLTYLDNHQQVVPLSAFADTSLPTFPGGA